MTKTIKATSDLIQKIAFDLGFDQAGVVRPESLEEGERALLDWVGGGFHGDMKYLENFKERKESFLRDFSDIRSVIVLGVNYFSRETRQDNNGKFLTGKVARYAWGRDYHQVIREKHETFIERLRVEFGNSFRAKSCVDIQPIPERFAAVRAGLGFAGKHTGILNHKFGPWLFLSEIVTNLDLEASAPSSGDCGTCNDCQTVCPTGALDKDYRLDARLCIAYLTIEHKGVIPVSLRPAVKDWLFGCDECLNVCPFTSKSKQTAWEELTDAGGVGSALNIADIFSIKSNSEHEKRFHGTALSRVSRKQLLRNACVVLGNSGKAEAIPWLKLALEDTAPLVRQHAAWGLGRFSNGESSGALKARLSLEKDLSVIEEINEALKNSDEKSGLARKTGIIS